MMNKGFEVIEAYHLFGIPAGKIGVLIHPVSVVHSMVEFADGFFKAQLGKPDMRLPIQYALLYPERVNLSINDDDPAEWPPLQFSRVQEEKYPCLTAAYRALEMGGTAPAVINGADEMAVALFLDRKIPFGMIGDLITGLLNVYKPEPADSLEQVQKADKAGRDFVTGQVGSGKN